MLCPRNPWNVRPPGQTGLMQMRQYIDGHELVPGLRLRQHFPKTRFEFSVDAICHTVSPHTWRAEVRLGRTVLFTTEPFASIEEATRAAETGVEARLIKALTL